MELENSQWDKADADFDSWKSEQKESDSPFTDILKSAYLGFREKQKSWLDEICNRSLDYLKGKKERVEENLTQSFDFDVSQVNSIDVDSLSFVYSIDEFDLPEPHSQEDFENLRKVKNQRLIEGILARDQKVFNELYEFVFPKVVRFVGKYSGNLEKSKDVFQDGLLIFIEKVSKKDFVLSSSVSTYIFSICKNLWMNQYRKDKKTKMVTDFGNDLIDDITIIGIDSTPDIYEKVCKAINLLGDPCKQLLECFYYKELSYNEIADSLGYASPESAKNQKYKCLMRIKKTVDYNPN